MAERTNFAGLHKVGTYLDEDRVLLNENSDILDAQLKQAHLERQEEEQSRAEGDAALDAKIAQEAQARTAAVADEAAGRLNGDSELSALLQEEATARRDGDAAEAEAREDALQAHDASAVAHNALVRRITVGNMSPVIGVCQVEAGNHVGLWCHVDGNGQPVQPNARYFDYHPVYSGMRRVLVDGQVMVEIPCFYIRHMVPADGPFAGRPCKIISPTPQEGFRPYPAFLSTTGAVLDKIYVAAFQSTNEGGSPVKAGSRPGKYPLVNATIDTMRQYCANRNVDGVSGFHMWDIYEYNAICLLFLIEFANTDSQAIMGRGWVDSSAAVLTDDQYQPYWRGFTGLFGNVWQFVDGIRLTADRRFEIFKNDGSRTYVNTQKVCPSYDGTNTTRIVSLHTGEGEGFCLDDCILPATHSGTASQGMFPDNLWGGYGSAGNILIIGGCWDHAGGAGLFCLNMNNTPSNAWPSVGCRSAKH